MPVYCYKSDDGIELEKVFNSWKDKDKEEIVDITGRKFIKSDGKIFYRDIVSEKKDMDTFSGNWPQYSNAAGVGAHQVGEARAESIKAGVPTDFTKDGKVIFRDRGHRKKYLKSIGMFDRDGGYSD